MKLNELLAKFNGEIRKGRFVKAQWKSVKGEYEKVSSGVVRFVEYAHIKGVEPKGKGNESESYILPSVVYVNGNTGKTYVRLYTTNVKSKVAYLRNGKEITKEEYEIAVKPRKSANRPPVFSVLLENLISLG